LLDILFFIICLPFNGDEGVVRKLLTRSLLVEIVSRHTEKIEIKSEKPLNCIVDL